MEKQPGEGRLTSNKMYQTRYGAEWNYQVAEAFTEYARERGYHPVSLAVAWAGSHPAVTAPIIGARNVDQLNDSLAAVEIEMSDEMRAEISALSPEPPPATDRSSSRPGAWARRRHPARW